LRSPDFKSTVSPKDFTFLNAQKWDAVAVFEGFIDFLSLIASGKQWLPELTNFLVLNSLSFLRKQDLLWSNTNGFTCCLTMIPQGKIALNGRLACLINTMSIETIISLIGGYYAP
jgi:hypothetical protein